VSDPAAASGGLTFYLKGLSPKARQYLVLGGLGAGFIGLVFGSIAIWDNQPAPMPQSTRLDKASKNIVTPGAQVDPRDVWMAQSSQQMKEMDNVIQGLKQKMGEVEQKQSAPQPSSRQASVLPPLPPMLPGPGPSSTPQVSTQGLDTFAIRDTGNTSPAIAPSCHSTRARNCIVRSQ
jgi:hypothetical protein